MRARPLIIPPRLLLGITLVAVAYGVITEALHLYPLSWPMPDQSFVNERLGECTALWVLLCAGAHWLAVWRQRPPPPHAIYWPLLLVPVTAGAYVSAPSLWNPLGAGPFALQMACVPFIVGILGSILLWSQFGMIQRIGRTGFCHNCGYNLKGTPAGRCPECGLQIDADGTARNPLGFRWAEILLFETAAERDAVIASIRRERNLRYALVQLVGLSSVAMGVHLGGTRELVLLGVGGLLMFPNLVLEFRHQRRRLRTELRRRGIRVCLGCGDDLRETAGSTCPACGRVDRDWNELRTAVDTERFGKEGSPRERCQ